MGTTIEPFKEDAKIAGLYVLHVKCYGVLNSCYHIKKYNWLYFIN